MTYWSHTIEFRRRFKKCSIVTKYHRWKRSSRDKRPVSSIYSNERQYKRLTVCEEIEPLKTWEDDTLKWIDLIADESDKLVNGIDFEPVQEHMDGQAEEDVDAITSISQTRLRFEDDTDSSEDLKQNETVEDGKMIERDENEDTSRPKSKHRKGFFHRIFLRRTDSATSTTTMFSEMKTYLHRHPTIRLGGPSVDPNGKNRSAIFQENFENTTRDLKQMDLDPLAGRRFSAAEGYRPQSFYSARSLPDSSPPLLPARHQAQKQQPEENGDELSSSLFQSRMEDEEES
jgi:hypothetical protein